MQTIRSRVFGAVVAFGVVAACGGSSPSTFDLTEDAASPEGGGAADLDASGAFAEVGPVPDASVAPCVGAECDDGAPPAVVCGDGVIGGAELCDDGNGKPGDGCSGVCTIEPGYTCPTPGQSCVYTVTQTCGNSQIEGQEICDDGNTKDGDGCSAACQIEPNYSCTTPGQLCTPTVTAFCSDGTVSAGEQCDDTNTSPGDGCNATCQIELGWVCPTPGQPCTKLEYCGDSIKNGTEECDDGNAGPGDGCSGVCKLEPGYACPAQGQACVKIWVCGNAHVDPGEACDDGNVNPNDGCAADCTLVEPGYTCPTAGGNGGPCTKAPANTCGDGKLAGAEQCDDGNSDPNDGCTAGCAVTPGWTCPTPGALCTKIAFCSDGNVDLVLGEQCDDKNTNPGDGCSSLCQLEPNYVCLTPGQPCTSTVKCGDKKIGGAETCDDGNAVSFDGCSSGCQVETGWTCPYVGVRCIAKQCGDGIVAGTEQCDDKNSIAGDGCTACKLDKGFACTTNAQGKSVCHATTCGDKVIEGSEQCDDGNTLPFDGCYNCLKDPQCTAGVCQAQCGDGQRYATEECDDGNTVNFDGCSSDCKVEVGFTCTDVTQTPPTTIKLPVLIRDFIAKDHQKNGATYHPDFNRHGGSGILNITTGALTSDGRPDLNCPNGDCTQNPGHLYENPAGTPNISTKANFDQWYRDDAVNVKSAIVITLDRNNQTGNYTWDSANTTQNGGKDYFDPVGTGGWVALGKEDRTCSPLRNVSFTSETHFWFEYQGGERFDFAGDDDTWIFLNGKLAVDLGGLHTPRTGYFQLASDPDGAGPQKPNGHGTVFQNISSATADVDFGLVQGGVYEVVMFQAERNECGSNFKVTLKNFARPKSSCVSTCGDGKVASDEVCDDGKNDGSYNGCMPGCKARGPFCGDGTTSQPPEACDDAVNASTYGGASSTACGPGCAYAPYCGDGVVSNGEQCDEGTGAGKNGSGYGHCSAGCTLGPRCGDGIVNGSETCDSGAANGSTGSPCKADCTLKCGDGALQPGEACDDGTAANVGGYGKCNPDCTLGPRCGDGFKNGTEQCDDGKNDGSYGTCKPDCTFAPYCGDGTPNTPPETCDLGAANSASAYGPNTCTKQCVPGPTCGNKAVDGAFGETCDDGVNSGQAGSCTPDCKSFVPLATCGNGKIDGSEACDDGVNNGTLNSKCDTHCRIKCGNGFKDPGEDCDNGVNDGSYGTCNPNCTLAGYCGDNIKNGGEQCDNGAANASFAVAYGPGVCTIACTFAPYCGDGRVQASFGEQCDGTTSCDSSCKTFVPK